MRRIKTATNDGLRQRFVDRFAPAALDLGLKIPDPDIHFDESSGHWKFSQPDWDEFFRVIRGDGPCNKKRVGIRRLSYEQGRWVRRAVLGAPPAEAA